ncbi:MAG: DUF3857 domain-containing protein [Chitinophagales bacterium]
MNLLYLKASIKKLYILLAFLSVTTISYANDSIPNTVFNNLCKNSDAYITQSFTDVVYYYSWPSNKRQVSIKLKMVINNKSGVEEYGFLNLSNTIIRKLVSFDVKTLKADGNIVELDSNVVFAHHSTKERSAQINYPIPGIEPGDTIVISYQYAENLRSHELMDFVDPYMYIPVANYEYTIRTSPKLLVRYKSYNGFPEPQIVTNDTLIYCVFKMEEVNAISENKYTCLPCELPYLYYSMEESTSETKTWKDIYNQEFNIITQPILIDSRKSSYYKKWKNDVNGTAKDSSKFYQFELLHADILNTVEMDAIYTNEMIKSNGYFLKEQRFDPISIRRLYRQILEDLEIEYYAVFAKNKRAGQIDPYFIRKGEFDQIFFAYINENDVLNLLYPHEIDHKYLIDEIPTSLYDTEAVIVKPIKSEKINKSDKYIGIDLELAEVDSVKAEIINLPGMDANNNYSKHIVYCDVNLKEKATTFKSKYSISGGLSTDIRSFYNMLNKNEEISEYYDAMAEYDDYENPLIIDTITNSKLKPHKPFTFSVSTEGRLEGALSFLSDSLISITLSDLIQHSQIESEEDSIDLNYYLDYSFTDYLMFKIEFPCKIEVLGYENYNNDLKNNFGEYSFNLSFIGDNQLVLQSNYKILKNMIPKQNYDHLKELNASVKEAQKMRLLIKLKDTLQN